MCTAAKGSRLAICAVDIGFSSWVGSLECGK